MPAHALHEGSVRKPSATIAATCVCRTRLGEGLANTQTSSQPIDVAPAQREQLAWESSPGMWCKCGAC
jgi:hypothetical protein